MAEENPNESKPAPVPQTSQPAPSPFTAGQETRVAMDLAGIQGVQRRQTIVRIIVVAPAVIASIALLYAIFSGD